MYLVGKHRLINSTETTENIEINKKANENIGVCWNNIDTFASLYLSKLVVFKTHIIVLLRWAR